MLVLTRLSENFLKPLLTFKIVLFKAHCTPMYGCQLWSSVFQYSLNKLKVAYNDGFRLLLNEPRWCSASTLFVYHNVPTFDALFSQTDLYFMEKLSQQF